jgi:hypothetical protein
MRKLLLRLSYSFFVFLSCCSKHAEKSQSVANSKSTIGDTTLLVDSNNSRWQISSSGLVGTDHGIEKDTVRKQSTAIAISHNSPEQEKIDSIKEAKQKVKGNPK